MKTSPYFPAGLIMFLYLIYILFNIFSRVVMGGISFSLWPILYWELNQQLGFYLL